MISEKNKCFFIRTRLTPRILPGRFLFQEVKYFQPFFFLTILAKNLELYLRFRFIKINLYIQSDSRKASVIMYKPSFALSFIVLALVSTSVLAASVDHPELTLSIDYAFFDSIKEYAVKPAINAFVLNNPLNQSVRLNSSGWVLSYDANFSNPSITDLTLDWPSSHFLTPGPNNGSILQIRNLNITVKTNYSIVANSIFASDGICNVTLTGINTDIVVAPVKNPNGTNYYLSIPNATFDFTRLDISFPGTVSSVIAQAATLIVNNLSKGTVTSAVTSLLTGDISSKVKNGTINGINLPYNNYTISIILPESPVVNVAPDHNYTNMGFEINIVNNVTGEKAPTFFDEIIAPTRIEGQQLQFMLASNVLNQIGWLVHQQGLIKASLSNKSLPPDAPISLNTTALRILLPQLADKYSAGKGVYVAVKSANKPPQFYTRDGRLVGVVATNIEFWVDTDSTRYPDEGLENCTTCEKGVAFNNTLLLELNIFKINSSTVGVTVLNVDMVDLNIIAGEGYDAKRLRSAINNVLDGLIPGINTKLRDGITIPIIGFLGINDITVNVNKNYLSLELSMKKVVHKRRRI